TIMAGEFATLVAERQKVEFPLFCMMDQLWRNGILGLGKLKAPPPECAEKLNKLYDIWIDCEDSHYDCVFAQYLEDYLKQIETFQAENYNFLHAIKLSSFFQLLSSDLQTKLNSI